jgi:hypothetical protein
MTAPKQLPDVRKDKGYKSESEQYANRQMDHLKVADVEAAIARAYLDGAQSALRVGYLLAEEDYKKTINYYKKQIENGKH